MNEPCKHKLEGQAAGERRGPGPDPEFPEPIKKDNAELEQLDSEPLGVLEVVGQDLRQPLIDQMNWCELLMSDSEHSLRREHLEHVARINSAANGMLARVNELLNEERMPAWPAGQNQTGGVRPRGRGAVCEENKKQHSCSRERPEGAESPSENTTTALQADQRICPAEARVLPGLDIDRPSADRADFKVLVVEHCSILREVLVGVLRQRFHVFSAADGWEALKLMVGGPQLIVTELDPPIVGAAEMLRHARHVVPDFSVLAMYDAKDKGLLASARRLGVREALLKPFSIADLVAKAGALAGASGKHVDHSVLAVCPDPNERRALHHLLDSRYRTEVAASVEAAVEKADNPYHLLIVDTALGENSWQEVVRRFRGGHKDIKVLLLYDADGKGTAEALKEVRVNSAVLKPYAFDDLLLRVRSLFGIKEIDGRILRFVYRKPAI